MHLTKNRLKRAAAIMVVAIAVFTLSSCSVKSKRNLIDYARNNYGECKLVEMKSGNTGKDAYRTVYLKDSDTGIEYSVTSRMESIDIDGSNFGYHEYTSSDFMDHYSKYVINNAQEGIEAIAKKYDAVIKYPKITFNNRCSNANAESAAKELSKAISDNDVKGLMKEILPVYAEEKVYVGIYNPQSDVWECSKEYDVIDFVISHYDEDAKYLDSIGAYLSQFLTYDEIQRLQPEKSPSTTGRAYYFKDKNGKVFVAVNMSEWGIPENKKGGGIRLFRDTSKGMEEIEF